MHRYFATVGLVLAATACSGAGDVGEAGESEKVGSAQLAIGNGGQHYVYATPIASGTFQGFTHCPTNEFLKGVDPANGRRLVCEALSNLDHSFTDAKATRAANGTATCGFYSVAVGWNAANGALICRVITPGPMTGLSPLGWQTTTLNDLNGDSHKVDYFPFINPNGGFADEMPVCAHRVGTDGAITEVTTKLITYPGGVQVNSFFYTCGI